MARFGGGYAARSTLAGLLMTLGAAGGAAAEVACGDTIVGDAVMTANLWCDASAAPALTVAAGATLDMSGYVLACTGGGQPGVSLAGSGSAVRDGAVAGCQTGVLATGDGGRVENVVVAFSLATVYGIRVTGNQNVVRGCAVADARTNGFNVEGSANRVLRNVGAGGGEATFRVSGAGNRLVDNLAYFSNFNGFLLSNASNTKLRRNVAVIGEVGFAIYGTGNRLDGNTSAGQGIVGFALSYDSSANVLRGNSSQFSVDGFDVSGPMNALRRNRAYGHGTNGITAYGSQCTIAGNVSIGNTSLDLSDLAACENDWRDNVFGFRNATCIE